MDNRNNYYIYFATLAVNCISFSTGGAFSWPSPVLPKLQDMTTSSFSRPITTFESACIASILLIGASTGSIISGFVCNRKGRKKTLLAFSVPMLIAHIIFAFSDQVYMFYIGRLLWGLGCGCTFTQLPNYVSEISEDSNRGLLGSIMGLMITTGTWFYYVVGPFVSLRVLSIISLTPLVVFIILFGFFVPESPYYLTAIGLKPEAEHALAKFRNQPEKQVKKELEHIRSTIEESQKNKGNIKDIFKLKGLKAGLLVTIGLVITQQFSGILAVLGYMQNIFAATGVAISPEYAANFIGFVQLVTNVITSQLIDRLGRRILIISSCLGSSLSLLALGVFFYLQTNGYNTSSIFWLPITSLFIFIVSYNLGLGPLPWTVMGELFPSNYKALASTITAVVCLSTAYLISMFFPMVSIILTMAGSFWLFSVFPFFGAIFIYFTLPETKGKSLKEIQDILNGVKK